MLFQKTSSSDILSSFIMYVYTTGNRCVIDYLEGVKTMPDVNVKQIRTAIFMDTILSYLDYQRNHEVRWCHLFACTPKFGSVAYIFNHLPNPDTRPLPARQESLMNFYYYLLNKGKDQGIVSRISTVHNELVNIIQSNSASLLDIWSLEEDFLSNHDVFR